VGLRRDVGCEREAATAGCDVGLRRDVSLRKQGSDEGLRRDVGCEREAATTTTTYLDRNRNDFKMQGALDAVVHIIDDLTQRRPCNLHIKREQVLNEAGVLTHS
jgi:hypothetical protein